MYEITDEKASAMRALVAAAARESSRMPRSAAPFTEIPFDRPHLEYLVDILLTSDAILVLHAMLDEGTTAAKGRWRVAADQIHIEKVAADGEVIEAPKARYGTLAAAKAKAAAQNRAEKSA